MEQIKKLLKDDNEVDQKSTYMDKSEQFFNSLKSNNLRICLGIPEKLVENKSVINGWEHKKCEYSESSEKITETRIVKCFYYRNNKTDDIKCLKEKCPIKLYGENFILNNCDVLDYEIPIKYISDQIGEFDLLIKYQDVNYAIEVKQKGSKETILRMILEILTYDYCNCYDEENPNEYNHSKRAYIYNKKDNKLNNDKGLKYELGIAFFEESEQWNQYNALKENDYVIKILNEFHISVFVIKADKEAQNGYTIIKTDWCNK